MDEEIERIVADMRNLLECLEEQATGRNFNRNRIITLFTGEIESQITSFESELKCVNT